MTSARISILATIAAVLALLWLYSIHGLFGDGPVSISLQVTAVLLMLWARFTFGLRSLHAGADPTEGELVTRGPYAIVRNPIYAAACLFTWTAVADHFGPASAVCGLVVVAAMLVRIFAEERLLRARFPEYAAYERRVKRLVPFVF